MAQTPALIYAEGDVIDYTPASAVAAGAVVLIGSIPVVCPSAIAADVKGAAAVRCIAKIPQTAEVRAVGDAVYWDVDGTPVTGDALSGAGASSSSLGNLIGICTEVTAATDTYVKVLLTAGVARAAVVGGAVTATDIAAEDSTLTIAGLDAAQGGSIPLQGGTSSTAGFAGGAVSLTGGTGGATGNGGAASVVGGVPGGMSGTGGAATLTGGASGGGTNYTGGAAAVAGGAGKGSGAGGAATLTGGAAGATGAGGAVTLTAAAGGTTSGAAGVASMVGGAGNGTTNGTGGATSITGGAGKGSGAGGAASTVGGVGGATGAGGAIAVTGGAGGSSSGTGGAVVVSGGAGAAGNASGGAVTITGGAKNGSGANGAVGIGSDKATVVTIGYASGKLILVGIPTSNPTNAGEVWANSNVLTLSTG